MDRIGRASYLELAAYYRKNVMPDKILEWVNRSKNIAIPQTIQPLLAETIRVRGETLKPLVTLSINSKGRHSFRFHREGVRSSFLIFKNWILRKVQGGYYLSIEEVQCILFFLDAFSKLL
jgi:hypothetical protein